MADCSSCLESKGSPRNLCSNELAVSVVAKAQANEGHSVILPKRHITSIKELIPEEAIAMHELAIRTMGMLAEAYGYANFVVATNEGELLKRVAHLHQHIIPMKKGPPLDAYRELDKFSKKLDSEALARMASEIKNKSEKSRQ
jgi:diadenosine tetraphosphate (Ap4A) HIT family hydrolase